MASTSTATPNVWFITGCSSGLGREFAKAAREHGDYVIATARNVDKIDDLKQLGCATFALDVTASDEIVKDVVAKAVEVYGRIDILVNNAGYALVGAVEECSAKDVYDQFNTNLFGVLTVTRAVLPYMRARRSGTIANIGSGAGWSVYGAAGLYNATKFALAAVSQTLRLELAPLGIEVTVVEFGGFRTNFRGTAPITAEYHIKDLEESVQPCKDRLRSIDNKQPGDPVKGAKLMIEALTKTGRCAGHELPARLPIGKDVVGMIDAVLDNSRKELDAWKDLAVTTDFD